MGRGARNGFDVDGLVAHVLRELEDPSVTTLTTRRKLLDAYGAPDSPKSRATYYLSRRLSPDKLDVWRYMLRAQGALRMQENYDPQTRLEALATARSRHTKKSRRKLGEKSIELVGKKNFVFEGVRYDSGSEAACAAMLIKYANFQPEYEITIQVPVGGCSFDFYLQGREDDVALVDYHPGMFKASPQLRLLRDPYMYAQFKSGKKMDLEASALSYKQERLDAIERDSFMTGTPHIMVTSPREFYREVLVRFGEDLPGEARALNEFAYYRQMIIADAKKR
jgi:hypothetical protein